MESRAFWSVALLLITLGGPALPDVGYDQERAVRFFEDGKCSDAWAVVVRGIEAESELAAIDLITMVLLGDLAPPGGFSSDSDAKSFIAALVAKSVRYDDGNSEEEKELLMSALETAKSKLFLKRAISSGCFDEAPQEECKSILDGGQATVIVKESLKKFKSAQNTGLVATCM